MHMDVVDLKSFYRTTQGEVARRILTAEVRQFWPDVKGLEICCLGYGAPYARHLIDEAASSVLFMPAAQGVHAWPPGRANVAALVDETLLPLPDGAIDRLLLVHALETSDALGLVLGEVARVLRASGQVIAIVPNRRGLWARRDETAFGHGRPFSRRQLAQLFDRHGFAVEGWSHALFVPPYDVRVLLKSAGAFERIGRRFWPGFSGAIVMLAVKRLYAPRGVRRPFRLMMPAGDLLPAPAARGSILAHEEERALRQ